LGSLTPELSTVEEHYPSAETRKIMHDLEVRKRLTEWQYFLQKRAQRGDVPLAVAQLIHDRPIVCSGAT
jgi:hypothetical protein